MPQEELLQFLRKRANLLEGVCITGGEPTLHADLPQLLEQIQTLGLSVKLDTNGTRPEFLRQLLCRGLVDYVAMDIKNAPDQYAGTCGSIDVLAPVQESVRLIMDSGVDYEFRTTVLHPWHTPETMAAIGRWISGAKRYYLQPFVDSGDLIGSGQPVTADELQALLDAVIPFIPNAQLRGV